jgi:hypothetical protein
MVTPGRNIAAWKASAILFLRAAGSVLRRNGKCDSGMEREVGSRRPEPVC